MRQRFWIEFFRRRKMLGASDRDRALNYLAVRYPGIYARAAECHDRDLSLTSIDARQWVLSAPRRVVEVIFTFTQRKNEFIEKFAVRVDVDRRVSVPCLQAVRLS